MKGANSPTQIKFVVVHKLLINAYKTKFEVKRIMSLNFEPWEVRCCHTLCTPSMAGNLSSSLCLILHQNQHFYFTNQPSLSKKFTVLPSQLVSLF